MKNKENNMKSFYVNSPNTKSHTISTVNIEAENVDVLIENLLLEFQNSSEEEKNKYRPILKDWLSSMDESVLFQDDEKKVRDFIYEMF
jgi:hypothetical protein